MIVPISLLEEEAHANINELLSQKMFCPQLDMTPSHPTILWMILPCLYAPAAQASILTMLLHWVGEAKCLEQLIKIIRLLNSNEISVIKLYE